MKDIPKPVLIGLLVIIVLFIVALLMGGSEDGIIQFDLNSLRNTEFSLGDTPVEPADITASAACWQADNRRFIIEGRCTYTLAANEANVRKLRLAIIGTARLDLELEQPDAVTVESTISSLPEDRADQPSGESSGPSLDDAASEDAFTGGEDDPPIEDKVTLDIFEQGGELTIWCREKPEDDDACVLEVS